jgi:hypothetical protein
MMRVKHEPSCGMFKHAVVISAHVRLLEHVSFRLTEVHAGKADTSILILRDERRKRVTNSELYHKVRVIHHFVHFGGHDDAWEAQNVQTDLLDEGDRVER